MTKESHKHDKKDWSSLTIVTPKSPSEIPTGKNRIPDIEGVYFVHRAIRRDMDLFLEVIDKLDLSTPGTSYWHRKNFSKYLLFHADAVNTHHRIEDTIFFPYLIAYGIKIDDSLSEDHEKVEDLLSKISECARIISPDSSASDEKVAEIVASLKPILEEYRTTLLAHLKTEEAQVNKPLRDTIPAQKYQKECTEEILKVELKNPLVAMVLCWFLDSDLENSHIFLNGELSWVPRQLYYYSWVKQYNREYKNLLTSIIDPNVPSPHLNEATGCKCTIM